MDSRSGNIEIQSRTYTTVTISRADLDEGVVRFSSNLPGPHRLFLIGLHPDEAGNVWPSVLSQIEEELCFGMVTAVYCFPGFPLERAVGEEKEDPNRCFPPPDDGVMKSPLYRRLHTIQQYVDECDELVDFHRYNKKKRAHRFYWDVRGRWTIHMPF